MPRMLEPSVIRDIQRLLDAGHPQRAIARDLAVSRNIVVQVARGQRVPQEPAAYDRRKRFSLRRCPDCGGIVEMPCRLCQTRELIAGGHLRSTTGGHEPLAKLDLRPEHHNRYLEVRRWRRLAQQQRLSCGG